MTSRVVRPAGADWPLTRQERFVLSPIDARHVQDVTFEDNEVQDVDRR